MTITSSWLDGKDEEKEITISTDLPRKPNSNVTHHDIERVISDIRAAISNKTGSSQREIIVKSRRPQSAVLSYDTKPAFHGRSSNYRPPFHDYSEIARAIDTESYLARSVQKHREYILKEGWDINGSDPEAVTYVRDRLFEIALATGLSTDEWIREIVTNLVSFSSAFLVMKRDPTKSTGRRIRLHGKKLDPIAGLFPMDPVSVKVLQNSSGRPVRWRQEIDGQHRTFNADDVVDITIDRKSGFVFGTPYSITVLDDIRALRRLEELIEMVAHKHLFPMFHVKIGTEKSPAQDIETPNGTIVSEVEIARQQIQEVPAEGGLVTSERYEFKLIGAEGQVLDLSEYLEHFKTRVMSGLRLSPLDLGQADTGNKATAQVVNRNLVDAVKDFQRVISDQLTTKLFDIILLEGGFNLTRDTRVRFAFPTADREEERSQQQHGLSLFQGNAITCTELRQQFLRKEQFTEEEKKDTFFELFEMPVLDKQLKAKAAAQSSSSSSSTKKSKDSTTVRTRPRNQYGISASKPTFPINDIMEEWEFLKSIAANNISAINTELDRFKTKASCIVSKLLKVAVDEGVKRAKTDCNHPTIFLPYNFYKPLFDRTLQDNLQKVLEKIKIMISTSDASKSEILSIFDAVGIELRVKTERMYKAAQQIGYIKAASQAGEDKVQLTNADGLVVGMIDTDILPRMVFSRLSEGLGIKVLRDTNEQDINV